MSSKGSATEKRRKGDDWRSDTMRKLSRMGQYTATAQAVIQHIPEEWADKFSGFDTDAKLLKCRIAACFRAKHRGQVLGLMASMRPIPLVHVKYNYEPYRTDHGIWPITYENPQLVVRERFELAPFLFTVHQGLNFSPIRSVQWVTRVEEHRLVVLNVELVDDPAAFEQEREGVRRAGTPGAFKYRWVRNEWFPAGWETGWFGRWDSDPNVNAHCTMFWPLSKYPVEHESPLTYAMRMLDTARVQGHQQEMEALRYALREQARKEDEGP